MTRDEWSGRRVTEARRLVGRTLPCACGKCGLIIERKNEAPEKDQTWVVGHKQDRWSHPHRMWDPSNWQAEHRGCSDASGQAAVIAKARAEGAASVQHSLFDASGLAVLPADDPSGQ